MKKKLTDKQKQFVKSYTDPKNKETFLNATQSALSAYNTTPQTARAIGSEVLANPNVQNEIKKRISTKDEDQQTLTRYVEKLDDLLRDETGITPERTAFIREIRELIKLNGQFRGDFVEKTLNLNVNVSSDFTGSADQALNDVL